MLRDIGEEDLLSICENIRRGAYPHVNFFIGSYVSKGGKSNCCDVTQIRNKLVLEPIRKTFGSNTEIVRTIDSILQDRPSKDYKISLARAVRDLPFEQFMSSLSDADESIAEDIIHLSCGLERHSQPNANHEMLVDVSRSLVSKGFCREVTIFTTNFDLCLDIALWGSLDERNGRESGDIEDKNLRKHVLTFRETSEEGRKIRLVKLHGCVSRPESLVHTFERMARLIFAKNIYGLLFKRVEGPSLYISLGYGFWDPDLRPFVRVLADNSRMVRADIKPQTFKTIPTGAQVMRTEFFKDTSIERYFTNIFTVEPYEGNRNIILALHEELAHGSERKTPSAADGELAPMKEEAQSVIEERMDERTARIFLTALVDSCARSESTGLIADRINTPYFGNRRLEMLRRYLLQLSHKAGYEEVASEALAARLANKDIGTRTLCSAHEIFNTTIRNDRKTSDLFNGLRRYIISKPQSLFADSYSKWFYEYYEAHMLTKFLELVFSAIARRARFFPTTTVLRPLLWWTRKKLTKLAEGARKRSWLMNLGECHENLAQVLILSGDAQGGIEEGENSRLYHSSIGSFNNILWADRALGWAHLAVNNAEEDLKAIVCFARGLWRSTYSEDSSAPPKLVLNLLRVLTRKCDASLTIEDEERTNLNEVRKLARLMTEEYEATPTTYESLSDEVKPRRAIARLSRYVFYLYPKDSWKGLRDAILKPEDIHRDPIFLPPDPPKFFSQPLPGSLEHAL